MEFSSVLHFDSSGNSNQPETDSSISSTDTFQSQHDFLSVLGVLRQYDVPSIDIRHAVGTTSPDQEQTASASSSQRASERYSHALGGGYSAKVLQHSSKEHIFSNITAEDITAQRPRNLVVKAGTVVALKMISPQSSTSDTSEAFRTICQEIKVCYHPLLRKHENIAKLLYVGWERRETFPWLALELATFGTLEDVLTAPGEGPTFKQKSNLTIDIALGVAALHHVGIVHGDLKPANILIQHHPTRQVVGQIADFGGSAEHGYENPIIGTPLWYAPEICERRSDINWKLADTWSYGLIVASIWSHVPAATKWQSSCFLDKHVPVCLEDDLRDARLLLLKTEPDHWSGSLIAQCSSFPASVLHVLRQVLSSRTSVRRHLQAVVVHELDSICAEIDRTIPFDYYHEPVPAQLRFAVWAPGHRSRDFEYKRTVYEHLLDACAELRHKVRGQLVITDSTAAEQSLTMVQSYEQQHGACFDMAWGSYADSALSASRVMSGHTRQAIAAFQVAISHCFQIGVELDEKDMVNYATTAAKGGHPHATWIAPLLAWSSDGFAEDRAYHLGCLVIGACIGSNPSLSALKLEDSLLYASTRKAIQSRCRPIFPVAHGPASALDMFMTFREAPPLDSSTCGVMDAIRSQNIQRARSILQKHSTDMTRTGEEYDQSALHALSYLPDEDTMGLALLAYVNGASLSQSATDSELITVFTFGQAIEGQAIYWAAVKGMSLLFTELLELHEQTSTIIEESHQLEMRVASLHHHEILRMLLTHRKNTSGSMIWDNSFGTEEIFLQALLGASLATEWSPLSRRLVHGSRCHTAQTETVRLLLGEGAKAHLPCFGFQEFVQEAQHHTAITLSIANDDERLLSLLLTEGRYAASDVDMLQLCTVHDALRCFKVILKMYPQLANPAAQIDGLPPTMTPLIMAARKAQPEYALALLEAGADTTVHHMNFSSLARAVCDGYLETAEVIYNFCSDEESKRTFGHNETTGFTLTGRVMSRWATTQKTKALIDAMQWIDSKNGAYFECEKRYREPVWNKILERRAPSSAEQVSLDNMMLSTLFDMFPTRINQPDPEGLYPIHRATLNGHGHAVEMLLTRGVDIDAETIGSPVCPANLTAFTLAMHRLEAKPPFDISRGGKVEIRRWRKGMDNTLRSLLKQGATTGKTPRQGDFLRSLQYLAARVSFRTADSKDQDDETEWEKTLWPQKLPLDETSLGDNQRNGRELLDSRIKDMSIHQSNHSEADRTEAREAMTVEEQHDLALYGVWLLDQVKVRRQQCQGLGNTSMDEKQDYLSRLPLSWQHWHTFSLKSQHLAQPPALTSAERGGIGIINGKPIFGPPRPPSSSKSSNARPQ